VGYVTIPAVEVEHEFRERLESVLREGETVESFVADSVRRAVEFRCIQSSFLARGEAAWQEFQRTGVSHSVDEVCDKIQLRIDEKRRELLLR